MTSGILISITKPTLMHIIVHKKILKIAIQNGFMPGTIAVFH